MGDSPGRSRKGPSIGLPRRLVLMTAKPKPYRITGAVGYVWHPIREGRQGRHFLTPRAFMACLSWVQGKPARQF
jgi:hypothetical protein